MISTLPSFDEATDFARTAPGALGQPGPTGMPRTLDELGALLDSAPPRRAPHLGEALIERGLIDPPTLQRALGVQERTAPHRLLGQLLVDDGAFSQAQLNLALSEWLGVKVVDLRLLKPSTDALERLPRSIAEREGVLPLLVRGDKLVAAVPNPWDHVLLDQLRFVSELRIVPVVAVGGTLAPAVARAYASAPVRAGNTSAPRDTHDLAAELAASGPLPAEGDLAIVSESESVNI